MITRRTVFVTAAGCVAGSLIAGCGGSGLQTGRPPKAVSPAASTVIFDCGGKAQLQPSSLVLACADAGIELSKLRWSDWGDATATADSTEITEVCVPSCVDGHLRRDRVKVIVDSLTLQGSHTAYGSLTVEKLPVRPGTALQAYNLTADGPVIDEVAK